MEKIILILLIVSLILIIIRFIMNIQNKEKWNKTTKDFLLLFMMIGGALFILQSFKSTSTTLKDINVSSSQPKLSN